MDNQVRIRQLILYFLQVYGQLQWGGWFTRHYAGVSAVDTKTLLVITVRCFPESYGGKHADLYKNYSGSLVPWEFLTFDAAKHWHVLQLVIEDPANRWDSRHICNVYVLPDDEEYGDLMQLLTEARKIARYSSEVYRDSLCHCVEALNLL